MGFLSNIKTVSRVSRVVSVLASNSMSYYISQFGLKWHLPFFKRLSLKKTEPDSLPVRLRQSMEQLGGFYVKLGQFLSLRPDLVPEPYRIEFAKLQDRMAPLKFEEIKTILEKELNKKPEELFEDISEIPLGSASIAQVHLARLKSGGTVILKIKRPNIEDIFKEDIAVLYYIAKKIEHSKKYPNFSPAEFIQEFERYTSQELNFIIESDYLEKFCDYFKNDRNVKTPKPYKEFCTKNLLVMEYIKGKKLREFTAKELRSKRKAIAETLVTSLLKQIFEIGLFHADLHPGNVLVLGDHKIALIDFGIIGRFSEELQKKGTDLYISLILGDSEAVANALINIGRRTPEFNQVAFKRDVEEVINKWHNTALKQHRVTTMMHHLLDTSIQHNLKIPVDAILFAKALVTVEGTCLQLNPEFNFVKFSDPYIHKLAKKKLKSESSLRKFLENSKKLKEVAYSFPFESYDLVKKLNRGDITIDIDDIEIKNLATNISSSSTILSTTMIISAFIVALALILSGKLNLSQTLAIIIFISIILLAIVSFMIIKKRR